MAEKLERIFEFRVLLAKAQELQIPLDAHETARLERLRQQLPTAIPSCDDRDAYTLLAVPVPAQYVCGGQFGHGVVRNASGGGLAISTDELPSLGQRIIVHVRDPAQGMEYTFPGRVVARVIKGVSSIGVAFEGVPTVLRMSSRNSGVFRADDTPVSDPRGPRKRSSA